MDDPDIPDWLRENANVAKKTGLEATILSCHASEPGSIPGDSLYISIM